MTEASNDREAPKRNRGRRRRRPTGNKDQQQARTTQASKGPRRQPRRVPRRGKRWHRYLLDLLVIVVGIMVSFLLNEWRQGKEDIRKEQRLLIALREDVRADSISFANELAELSELIEVGLILVERETLPTDPDSVMLLLSSCASYISFPFNDITYEEIRATGAGALIRDKALLRRIIEMYDKHLPMMSEYQSIDKWMVLERVFPFLEPRLVLADPDPAVLTQLRNDTQWRNLVTSNVGFKAQMRGEMTEHLQRIDSLGIMLDKAIAKAP